MAPHSSPLARKTPWTESLVGCNPWGREELDTTSLFTFHFHASEKEKATHSSVLAWRIPGTEEPGGLLSVGSHGVRHDWSDSAAANWCGRWRALALPRVHLSLLKLLLLVARWDLELALLFRVSWTSCLSLQTPPTMSDKRMSHFSLNFEAQASGQQDHYRSTLEMMLLPTPQASVILHWHRWGGDAVPRADCYAQMICWSWPPDPTYSIIEEDEEQNPFPFHPGNYAKFNRELSIWSSASEVMWILCHNKWSLIGFSGS